MWGWGYHHHSVFPGSPTARTRPATAAVASKLRTRWLGFFLTVATAVATALAMSVVPVLQRLQL